MKKDYLKEKYQQGGKYIIKSGDNLSSVSKRLGVSIDATKISPITPISLEDLQEYHRVQAGEPSYRQYKVKQGQDAERDRLKKELIAKGQTKIGNALTDLGTGIMTWGTELRPPSNYELQRNRRDASKSFLENWYNKSKSVARGTSFGLADIMTAGVMSNIGKSGRFATDFIPTNKANSVVKEFSPKFKSEIDWSKWNPDTPNHKILIDEYNSIEESTKKLGTWMKNPDGTDFLGSPEQFIQQQSSWFKKSYPNGFKETFRGGDVNPELNSKWLKNSDIVFTTSDEYGAQVYNRIRNPYIKLNKKEPPPRGISKLYMPETENKLVIDGKLDEYSRRNYARLNVIDQIPRNANESEILSDFKTFMTYNHPEYDLKDRVMTDHFATFLNTPKGKLVDRIEFKKIIDGTIDPIDVEVHNLNNKKQLKSTWGNVGFFDMTNPNIYKGLAPLIGLKMFHNTKKYQAGGYLSKSFFRGVNPTRDIPTNALDYISKGSELLGGLLGQKRVIPDKVAEAAWAKRLNQPYDSKYLPENKDGTFRLPDDVAKQINFDTLDIKNKIDLYNKIINSKIGSDYSEDSRINAKGNLPKLETYLGKLREAYKGNHVVVNEYEARKGAFDEYGYLNTKDSPLNVMGNFTIWYNPEEKSRKYQDTYDFNWLDWAVPGKSFKIKGVVPKKQWGGKINYIEEWKKKLK